MMVKWVLSARSLIVVRCFLIVIARCMLSPPYLPVAFRRYWIRSFGVRCTCSFYTAYILLMTAGYALLSFCCSLLAIGVCFFLFGFCNSLLSSRLLLLAQAARCLLLTESCSLFLTRYSRATVASLFSTHVFCWSLHVFADWSSLITVSYSLLNT